MYIHTLSFTCGPLTDMKVTFHSTFYKDFSFAPLETQTWLDGTTSQYNHFLTQDLTLSTRSPPHTNTDLFAKHTQTHPNNQNLVKPWLYSYLFCWLS